MHTLAAFAQKLRRVRRLARPPVTGGAYRWHMNGRHGDVQPGDGSVPAPAGLRTISVALGASALLAATIFSALPASASGIFVRAATAIQANEADIVAEGPNNTLQFVLSAPGRRHFSDEDYRPFHSRLARPPRASRLDEVAGRAAST